MRYLTIVCAACLTIACGPSSGPDQPTAPGLQRRPPSAETAARRAGDQPAVSPEASSRPVLATGQTLYVPAYSHVYWGKKPTPFNLACTLSIRNIDTRASITLNTVDYYDTVGALVGHYIDEPRTLAPLETAEFYIEEHDVAGGSGANFIVRWHAPAPVNAPIVEAVMIGIYSGQGVSFVSPAREIVE